MKLDYKEDLFYGNDIVINDHITIHQPTIGEIRKYSTNNEHFNGDVGYFRMVSIVTSTPADYDVDLDAAGVRYEDVNPMEFFFGLCQMYQLTPDVTGILFGDLDLTKFVMVVNKETGQKLFVNPEDVRIDDSLYAYVINIIREIHNVKENKRRWADEKSRALHMDMEQKRRKRRKRKGDDPKHILLPIISMMVNRPGFKYDRESVDNLNLYYFYECYKQQLHDLQVEKLMTGVYVGLIDTKKINLEESLNLLRQDI